MNYDFTQLCYVRFISGFIAITLALFLWRRRETPGALELIIFELLAALWAVADGFEAAAPNLQHKLHWAQVAYIGVTSSAVMFLIFSLSYTRNYRFLNRRSTLLLFLVPCITVLLAFTNSYHHLLWTSIVISPGTNNSIYYYGPYFWVHTFYQYGAVIVGLVILISAAHKTFTIFRAQFWLLILGGLFPFCGSIIYVFKLLPVQGIDFTPITFIISGILIATGLFKLGFLDIMPFAHQQAIDNLQDGLLVVDTEKKIVSSNPAFSKISGMDPKVIRGKKLDEILGFLGTKAADIVSQDEYSSGVELPLNGENRSFEIRMQPVIDSRQKPVGTMLTVHDITLDKMILDTIAESNRQKLIQLAEKEKLIQDLDAYARSVAHDLRNPAGAIIGLADCTINSIEKNDLSDALENTSMIRDAGYKMNRIIDDLLILSRIRKDKIEIISLDPALPVEEATARLKKNIDDAGAVIKKPAKWPHVLGQSQWLEQVWFNLISNAIKYGGEPPVITLGYSLEAGNLVRFSVNDNGKGLSAESISRLFNDFERLDKKDIDGHGLGLSIVKRILNKLGGTINVESTHRQGEGCTFSFTLKQS